MAAAKAITPRAVFREQKQNIPDTVYTVFNQLIKDTIRGNTAIVYQEDVVNQLVANGFCREEIFARHWLDIEDTYRAAGWRVTYDKPSYGENYFKAYFRFTAQH